MNNKKKWFFAVTLAMLCCIFAGILTVTATQSAQILTLYITLDDAEELVEKEYSNATLEVQYPGQIKTETLSLTIRHRGNTTYDYYDKKSYKIKLEDEFDFLSAAGASSENKANDWILLANYVDKTMLRNYYTFFAASLLDGILFASDSTFAEVYLQGEYLGVYQICEEVEIDEARLDLNDKTEGDNAVLLEYVHNIDTEYSIGAYHGDEAMIYEIHSEIYSEAQSFRAFSCIYAANEAIISGDQAAIETAIDIESCVDMYLLQEFVMNIDVGYSSFYLYLKEDDDTVYFGPPWDFDRSLGSVPRCENYAFLYAASDVDEENGVEWKNQWFYDLMQMEWFQDLVRERWNEKKEVFQQALTEIIAVEEEYSAFFQKDYLLWTAKGDTQDALLSYQAEQAELCEWIQNRYEWLDYYFNYEM